MRIVRITNPVVFKGYFNRKTFNYPGYPGMIPTDVDTFDTFGGILKYPKKLNYLA